MENVEILEKTAGRRPIIGADREIPYGPYLSMAAATLLFAWPYLWRGWAAGLFGTLYVIFWWILGINATSRIDPP